jgi:2-deoxy-D-gluconate 3-dehydrogenase
MTRPRLSANPERKRQILERIPIGRLGTSEELMGIAVFLAARASDYVCGAVIPVDGGFLAR